MDFVCGGDPAILNGDDIAGHSPGSCTPGERQKKNGDKNLILA
jgi:hypothetical protein